MDSQQETNNESLQEQSQQEQSQQDSVDINMASEQNDSLQSLDSEEKEIKKVNSNKIEKKRNQRLFGSLLGTLSKFKKETSTLTEAQVKRMEKEKLIALKLQQEKEESNKELQEKEKKLELKKQKDRELELLKKEQEQKELLKKQLERKQKRKQIAEQYELGLKGFLKTEKHPQIYFLPNKIISKGAPDNYYITLLSNLMRTVPNTGFLDLSCLEDEKLNNFFQLNVEPKLYPEETLYLSNSVLNQIYHSNKSIPLVKFKAEYKFPTLEERLKSYKSQVEPVRPITPPVPQGIQQRRAPSIFIPSNTKTTTFRRAPVSAGLSKGLMKENRVKMLDLDEIKSVNDKQKEAQESVLKEKETKLAQLKKEKEEKEQQKREAREQKQMELEEKRRKKELADEEKRREKEEKKKRRTSESDLPSSKKQKTSPKNSPILSNLQSSPLQTKPPPVAKTNSSVDQVLEGANLVTAQERETITIFLTGKYAVQNKEETIKLSERVYIDNGVKKRESFYIILDYSTNVPIQQQPKESMLQKLKTINKKKEVKLDRSMISGPANFNEPQPEEEKSIFSKRLETAINQIFSITTRKSRKKALSLKMKQTPDPLEKKLLKQEFLMRESVSSMKKTQKMSIDDFDILKTIGHGGFGVVRLVRERSTGEIFAMKSLTKQLTLEKHQEGHVKAERTILSAASELGEWIVKLMYCFQDKEFLYFVLEYMPGGDLLNLLIKRDIFPEMFARHYFAEIVMAIEEVHKLGMIHRDPDNFLFDASGHLKIADFGLAADTRGCADDISLPDNLEISTTEICSEKRDRKQTAYSVVGTNDYVAPEVLLGKGYDKSCDWWSAGVILFEMLFGYPAFSSSNGTITKKKILNWEKTLVLPPNPVVSEEAKDLIRKLICSAENRLGGKVLKIPSADPESLVASMMEDGDARDIKDHPWFEGFDWEDLQLATPPFIPQLQEKTDTSHFDEIDQERINMMMKTDDLDSYDSRTAFEGFTYIPSKGHMNVE
ncbi:hypothetical protein HDV06_006193 [Boothiomyces sp. JEL0866]|nr:hypothetical protein HDV06_006193 [Boothiomyces sp. JEL0866]